MKTRLIILCSLFTQLLFAQQTIGTIEFGLEIGADGKTYTVFAKPTDSTFLSMNTITGTGQVTIVVPTGFEVDNFKNFGGEWDGGDAIVRQPIEDIEHDYISIALDGDRTPKLIFQGHTPVPLFSFESKNECKGIVRLIDWTKDLFAQTPNSANSNPGNELGVIDLDQRLKRARYKRNYGAASIDCSQSNFPPILTSPISPIVELQPSKGRTIQWTELNSTVSYSIKIRLKGTAEWLSSIKLKQPKVYLYGAKGTPYEYQIFTILENGEIELSDIFEVSTSK